jgi:hypothetical protein
LIAAHASSGYANFSFGQNIGIIFGNMKIVNRHYYVGWRIFGFPSSCDVEGNHLTRIGQLHELVIGPGTHRI